METCSPKGRDCIERHSTLSFNCTVSCDGVYADVQWVNEQIEAGEELEEETQNLHWEKIDIESVFPAPRKVNIGLLQTTLESHQRMLMMNAQLERRLELNIERRIKQFEKDLDNKDKKGEALDKEKFKNLISDYKKFKMKNVRHFRFVENGNSSMFGRFLSKFLLNFLNITCIMIYVY